MTLCLKFGQFLRRNASTAVRVIPELDKEVYDKIEKNEMKPRKHPGVLKNQMTTLPKDVLKAVQIAMGDTPRKQLVNEGTTFARYLFSRQEPREEEAVKDIQREAFLEVKDSLGIDLENLDETQKNYYNQVIQSKVHQLVKQRVYNWEKIDFTRHQGLVYLFARAAPEYATLTKIFQEISANGFEPKTVFDFGSGVGTVVWAAHSMWGKALKEIFTIDSSSEMNDLSLDILTKLKYDSLKNRIFQRQFLPASQNENFDLVVSAYSLLELSSQKSRLETLLNLWRKTKKLLVLVEQGTTSGFRVLNEARSFILGLKDDAKNISGHVIAPCPHDFACPKMNSSPPICAFQVKYTNDLLSPQNRKENYSYVVLSKGERAIDDKQWPRIISPVLVRSRHAICRLCTKNGTSQEIIVSHGKHGKITHHCARSSSWGDRLPVSLKYESPKTNESVNN